MLMQGACEHAAIGDERTHPLTYRLCSILAAARASAIFNRSQLWPHVKSSYEALSEDAHGGLKHWTMNDF